MGEDVRLPLLALLCHQEPHRAVQEGGPSGKASYHVQFFKLNDESGWVNAVIEFMCNCLNSECFSKEENRQVLQSQQGSHDEQVGEGRQGG